MLNLSKPLSKAPQQAHIRTIDLAEQLVPGQIVTVDVGGQNLFEHASLIAASEKLKDRPTVEISYIGACYSVMAHAKNLGISQRDAKKQDITYISYSVVRQKWRQTMQLYADFPTCEMGPSFSIALNHAHKLVLDLNHEGTLEDERPVNALLEAINISAEALYAGKTKSRTFILTLHADAFDLPIVHQAIQRLANAGAAVLLIFRTYMPRKIVRSCPPSLHIIDRAPLRGNYDDEFSLFSNERIIVTGMNVAKDRSAAFSLDRGAPNKHRHFPNISDYELTYC